MNNIVTELKSLGIFYVATVDDKGNPHVRPFSSVCEFEGHAYLCSNCTKDFYKQLIHNNNVAICGMNKKGEWIRVLTTLEEDNRKEAKQAMLDDPTGPSKIYGNADNEIFRVFKMTNIVCKRYSFAHDPEEIKE